MPTLQAIGVNGLSNQKRGLRGPHYTTQGAEARCEVEHPSFGVIPFVLKVSRITYLSPYQKHACGGATILNNRHAFGSSKTFALKVLLREGDSSPKVQHLQDFEVVDPKPRWMEHFLALATIHEKETMKRNP